jgi:16S rRNA (guanine966-N2)-methyltransferase
MRIIAGELRGRAVELPKGSRIRPATGYVLEMVMSLFTPARLEAGAFLDICAGSGLVGLEALSRGAPAAVFVEAERATASALGETARRFGVAERCQILNRDARRAMPKVAETLEGQIETGWPSRISCIFMDPPYIPGLALDILGRFAQWLEGAERPALLDPDALLILRSPDRITQELPRLSLQSTRQAGSARIYVYAPEAR